MNKTQYTLEKGLQQNMFPPELQFKIETVLLLVKNPHVPLQELVLTSWQFGATEPIKALLVLIGLVGG